MIQVWTVRIMQGMDVIDEKEMSFTEARRICDENGTPEKPYEFITFNPNRLKWEGFHMKFIGGKKVLDRKGRQWRLTDDYSRINPDNEQYGRTEESM